jgi:hypothetical protein
MKQHHPFRLKLSLERVKLSFDSAALEAENGKYVQVEISKIGDMPE